MDSVNDDTIARAGFPHSEIRGSLLICSSPRLIAAYHVFLRLLVPRHPPCALYRLISRCIALQLIFTIKAIVFLSNLSTRKTSWFSRMSWYLIIKSSFLICMKFSRYFYLLLTDSYQPSETSISWYSWSLVIPGSKAFTLYIDNSRSCFLQWILAPTCSPMPSPA